MQTKLNIKPQGFCNSTMMPVNVGKPHIAFIRGYWRVSQYKPKVVGFDAYKMFAKAHAFTSVLNSRIKQNDATSTK